MPHRPTPLTWPCHLRPLSHRLPPSFPPSRPATSFHTSSTLRDDNTNHYETLGVQPTASAADIKKQYFHLSKRHHPDHNPHDPTAASARFVQIAEAYAILGSASKRQRYDRDFLPSQSRSSPFHRRGSHHSSSTSTSTSTSGPAGARPPSGLSKRRTHFRGPPPSFYRSGGWGAYGAKRQAQADAAASAGFAGAEASSRAASSSEYAAGGSRSGSAGGGPFGWGNDVPHFDRDGHFRTQEQHEWRRRRRMAAADGAVSFEGGGSMLLNFLFVGGIISFAVAVPNLFGRMVVRKRKEHGG